MGTNAQPRPRVRPRIRQSIVLSVLCSALVATLLLVSLLYPATGATAAPLVPGAQQEGTASLAGTPLAAAPAPMDDGHRTRDAADLSAFNCATVSQIPLAECQALVAFYNSANGPGWTNNEHWLATNTPCSWSYVTCSGGLYRAYDITATVIVADGVLTLDFVPHPGSNAPFVNAIAVTELAGGLSPATGPHSALAVGDPASAPGNR
jgi:hypothetical protein